MSNNLVVLLYVVFVALALVYKLGGGFEQIASAQLWHFSPPIEDQNQNANNLPFNKNAIQPSNVKPSMSSNCMATPPGAGGDIIMSSSSQSRTSDKLNTSTDCRSTPIENQNQNANNLPFNNNNPIQPNNVKPSISSNCKAISLGAGGDTKTSTSCVTQHSFNLCPDLSVTNDVGFIVPKAEVVGYSNIIKAVSIPPIVTAHIPVSITKGNNATANPTPPSVETPTSIFSQIQEICGTNRDDYIIGSEGDDIIFGLRDNDIITALGGDDQVFAGPGDDIVYGGDGNNQLFGDEGNDNLIGGINDDLLVGGVGNDRLYGNDGDDILQGGAGADYFDCGDGLDTVVDYNSAQGDVVSVNCENVNPVHGNAG